MAPSSDITEFRKVLESSKNIIVLSGAGLSAPSGMYVSLGHESRVTYPKNFGLGISTYRGTSDSLWSDPASNSVFVLKWWCSLTLEVGNSQIRIKGHI
jgi:NAD+-dependent protein deacetylase sirtuin 5